MLAGVLLALVVAVVFVGRYDFPKRVDLVYPAVEYRGDGASGTTKITIKGRLYRPLFRNATFRGRFIIDRYAFTRTHELIDVELIKRDGRYTGGLAYTAVIDGKPDLVLLGMFAMDGHFDKLSLIVNQQLTEDNQGAIVAAPADNLEAARSISDALAVRAPEP